MRLQSILRHVQPIPGFVYGHVELLPRGAAMDLHVHVRSRQRSRGRLQRLWQEAAGLRYAGAAGPVGTPVAVSEKHATLEFGKPTVKVAMGMTQVMVEAKNNTGTSIEACIVTATFKKADTILGTANGAVNGVPAGATRTAQLMSTDDIKGYDTVKLEASTCF
jgi:hypothetical protein